ncbi:MAG: hypothetical protein U5J98_07945 [Halobacteriales archaeon]|nr:hypothetical protein [Halobacteriales archaeon]
MDDYFVLTRSFGGLPTQAGVVFLQALGGILYRRRAAGRRGRVALNERVATNPVSSVLVLGSGTLESVLESAGYRDHPNANPRV